MTACLCMVFQRPGSSSSSTCQEAGPTPSETAYAAALLQLEGHLTCTHPNCDRTFQQPDDLQKHLNLHAEGFYRYQCNYCGKGFSCSSHVKGHIAARHTHVKPFQCEGCGKGYVHRTSLVTHIKSSKECERHYGRVGSATFKLKMQAT